jgi:hypothetical protein
MKTSLLLLSPPAELYKASLNTCIKHKPIDQPGKLPCYCTHVYVSNVLQKLLCRVTNIVMLHCFQLL